MKIINGLFLFLLMSISAMAVEVPLQWDASSDTVEGYAVFNRDFQNKAYGAPLCTTVELGCTVTVLNDRQTAFVVRAFIYGPYDLDGNRTTEWSVNSNEIIYSPPVVKPNPPRNLLVQIIVAVLDFFENYSA
jgi:hypothetical protein